MLCGYPPFFRDSQDKSETKLLRQIVRGKYKFHENFWGHVSEDAKHFVSRMMCSDPRLRLTVEEALCHPWIIKNKSWRHRDSGIIIILKSLLIIVFFSAVLALYFLILSGYFDLQDHVFMRFNQTKDLVMTAYQSLADTFETVYTYSYIKLSSLFRFNSSFSFTNEL